MYEFVDLNDAQKHERRQLLDWYAALAQISVIVPLLCVQLVRLHSWAERRWRSQTRLAAPSSPYTKEHEAAGRPTLRKTRRLVRWLAWTAGDAVDVFGIHLGTKGELLFAAIWIGWLVLLSFLQTGNDYLHLTKRFGLVAASQLPVHYLLSIKSPLSPIQILTGRSHDSLISIHQLLGRIIISLFYVHASLYTYFFVVKGLLLTKLTQLYIICGVSAVVGFTVIGTTSLAPVRMRNYRLFHTAHVVWATAILPILYFHVHHIRLYLWETLAVYLVGAFLRVLATKRYTATATLARISGTTDLVDIQIPTAASPDKTWHPGHHAYLALPGQPLLRALRANPFSLASIPAVDGHLRFVARVLRGNTVALHRHAADDDNHGSPPTADLVVEGPYGITSHADALLRADRVLFVAGGVGATFVVPLYRQLLRDLSPGKGSYRRQKVGLVWVARAWADVAWAVPRDERERAGFVERARICLTRGVEGFGPEAGALVNGEKVEREDDGELGGGGDDEEGIELEERKNLLGAGADGARVTAAAGDVAGLSVYAGRPDLAKAVDEVFAQSSTERVAVVVCGPKGLSRSVRKEVGRWVRNGRDVWYWEEAFAM